MKNMSHDQLNQLVCKIGGSVSNIEGDRVYQYQNNDTNILATSVDLGAGISFTHYDFDTLEDMQLSYRETEEPCIYFMYATSGTIDYAFGGSQNDINQMLELQTIIMGGKGKKLHINIPGGQKSGLAVIQVVLTLSETPSEDIDLNNRVFAYFLESTSLEELHYEGRLNLNIKELLSNLDSLKLRGVIRKLFTKGIVHCVLGLEIAQHLEAMNNLENAGSILTRSELIRIKAIVEQISQKPEYPYTISSLTQEYGVSARKLQEGFKILTDSTVNAYIHERRLIKAERLLTTGEMTVSEIVYAIGFNSRSYFSKIFKNKYNCSPSHYIKNAS